MKILQFSFSEFKRQQNMVNTFKIHQTTVIAVLTQIYTDKEKKTQTGYALRLSYHVIDKFLHILRAFIDKQMTLTNDAWFRHGAL